jgi:hypothetical protein
LQLSGPASCLQQPTSAEHTQLHWQHQQRGAQVASHTTSTAAAAPPLQLTVLLLLALVVLTPACLRQHICLYCLVGLGLRVMRQAAG